MKNKNGIKIALLALVAMMVLTGCGSKGSKVAGTYEHIISAGDLAGQTSHNGFLSANGASQINTLVLEEDSTYSYTKNVVVLDEAGQLVPDSINLKFIFTGKYTVTDLVVTLDVPEDVEFDEDWASLNGSYLISSQGKASAGDIVQCKEDESHDPLDFFLTPFYIDSSDHNSSVEVTVNTDDATFTYNSVSSSDDE